MARCPNCHTETTSVFSACPSGDGFYTIPDEDLKAFSNESLLGRAAGQRFVLHALIGRGAMAKVFRAQQLNVDRVVAVKVFDTRSLAKTPLGGASESTHDLARARFEREAKVLAQLSHPNCVTLYDYGSIDDEESLYIAMEHVEGLSMRRALKRGLRPEATLEVARQVLLALREAHGLGIVHRDLKPENVILSFRQSTMEPTVKVVDFGIAKMVNAIDFDATESGTLFGTPAYMSPEQCRGAADEVGPASDIYALGCVIYEGLTGRVPFEAPTPQEMLKMHQECPAPSLPDRAEQRLGDEVNSFLQKCLRKKPAERFQNADACLKALMNAYTFEGSPSFPGLSGAAGPSSTGKVLVPSDRIRGEQLSPSLSPIPSSRQGTAGESDSVRLDGFALPARPSPELQRAEKKSRAGDRSETWRNWVLIAALICVVVFTVALFLVLFTLLSG